RLTVAAGGTTTVDDIELPTGRIGGHLTTSAGAPAAGSTVSAIDESDHSTGFAVTGPDGSYELRGLRVGRYRVGFTLPGNSSSVQYAPATLDRDTAARFDVG